MSGKKGYGQDIDGHFVASITNNNKIVILSSVTVRLPSDNNNHDGEKEKRSFCRTNLFVDFNGILFPFDTNDDNKHKQKGEKVADVV